MIRYKLVTQRFKTREGTPEETLWEVGVKVEAKGPGTRLCSSGVIHSYKSPELAVLLNPIHADLRDYRLIKLNCGELVADDKLKGGHKFATMLRELPVPQITTIQKAAFGILCGLTVYKEDRFVAWAHSWLAGKDRSVLAARAARAAVRAKAQAAARAAEAATLATLAATLAARAAEAAESEAEWCARAAEAAAARAAEAALGAATLPPDFKKLAKKALLVS